jgi:hypothetical protein
MWEFVLQKRVFFAAPLLVRCYITAFVHNVPEAKSDLQGVVVTLRLQPGANGDSSPVDA